MILYHSLLIISSYLLFSSSCLNISLYLLEIGSHLFHHFIYLDIRYYWWSDLWCALWYCYRLMKVFDFNVAKAGVFSSKFSGGGGFGASLLSFGSRAHLSGPASRLSVEAGVTERNIKDSAYQVCILDHHCLPCFFIPPFPLVNLRLFFFRDLSFRVLPQIHT